MRDKRISRNKTKIVRSSKSLSYRIRVSIGIDLKGRWKEFGIRKILQWLVLSSTYRVFELSRVYCNNLRPHGNEQQQSSYKVLYLL